MIVTVFGSSVTDEYAYNEAYRLGKIIGLKKHILKNGAYSGTMEASAKGCSEVGGTVIGVGVVGHKIDRMGKPNQYNSQTILKENVNQRINELLRTDMVIVLKGNIGTLEEMFVAWVRAIETDSRPIVVVGEKMITLITYLFENDFLKKEHSKYILTVKTIEEIPFF